MQKVWFSHVNFHTNFKRVAQTPDTTNRCQILHSCSGPQKASKKPCARKPFTCCHPSEIHPLLIDVFQDEVDLRCKLEKSACNIYAPLNAGETQLLRAIRANDQQKIGVVLEAYRNDFEKVKSWLVLKHQWDVNERMWLKKTILVATTEEQCKNVKQFENKNISKEQLRHAVFVLLQHPVDDEDVAVLHPDEVNRITVIHLIMELMANGFLSWNYAEIEGKCETYMEAAAVRGLNSVMEQLFDLGAEIVIPGHNPLIQACYSNHEKTIEWLLNKHFDDFDCTLRNRSDHNALIAIMRKNNSKLFNPVLEKMIAYRVKHYSETKSQAFNEIFKFESDDLTSLSIFIFLRKSPMQELVEKAIVEYELDLSHEWKGIPIIAQIIRHRIALNYCFDYIRNNPHVLGIRVCGETTVVHELIGERFFDFLREIYLQNSQLKEHFNTCAAFPVLRIAITEKHQDKVQFMLEHHAEFFKQNMAQLRENVVCCRYYPKEFFEDRSTLLEEFFPELRTEIEDARLSRHSEKYYYHEMEKSFANMNINLTDIAQLPVEITRGSNGETLLHLAVDKNDFALFHKVLETGRDCILDTLDHNGNHPVHFVQSCEMLNLIVENHPEGEAVVHRTNNDGHSVLHKVCALRDDEAPIAPLIRRVIDYGANVNQLTNNGESAVFFIGNCDLLDLLKKDNPGYNDHLNVVSKTGETALERHLLSQNECLARPLLCMLRDTPTFKQHAHKYLRPMVFRGTYGRGYQDILEKYPETANMLIDSLVEHSRQEASQVFAKAYETEFEFLVHKFLDGDYDLDYNFKSEYQNTPLIGLISNSEQPNVHLMKRLLEKPIDLTARNMVGNDALMCLVKTFRWAKWPDHSIEAVQLLLDHDHALINTSDADGNTPLHVALAIGDWELVEVLLKNGADLEARNKDGKIPLQMTNRLTQELFYFLS